MPKVKKFMLITLGEELLLGLTANGHLSYIGGQLRQRGITLHSNYTISDEGPDIEEQFRYCWERADVLITTGGLGPTVDDRTKEEIASVLGEKLVFDQSILATIENRFRGIGKPMSENNRKQAYRPENAEVIENAMGTAPGLWMSKDGKILIMLPGPPNELQPMFENQIIPRLGELDYVDEQENYLQIKTIGIGESALENQLQSIFQQHENLSVAYCAHQGQVDCRISFPDIEKNKSRLLEIAEACKGLLGDDFLCFGHQSTVEVVSNILGKNDLTLATAESCTGGLIADTFTNLPGSSEYFNGGVVSYSDESKIQILGVPEKLIQEESAVSSSVAIAMAQSVAAKMDADYGLSVTGYAGPDGGTEKDPVGTVYIGLHTPSGTLSQRFSWKSGRLAIKKRTLHAAIDLLRRKIIAEKRNVVEAHENGIEGTALRK